MSESNQCPRCGAPLSAGSDAAFCPRCLLEAGFETPAATRPWSSTGESTPQPTPAELSAYFPQLEVLELLGHGGMGWVYKARQKSLDRFVALKLLPPEMGRDPAFAERFQREARALARLNHPNIVAVYDFGQAGRYCYFLMEYVDGANLRQLERTRPLPPEEAFALVPKICEALQFAHDEGIVHRDIKPENILVDGKGRVKIADFGIAKIIDRRPEVHLTGTNQIVGTPHYMAPEQFETPNKIDHRVDIYALGVVFYEMLTGELPLGRFEPPSKRLQVDIRVDDVVLRSLEKDPQRRYQSVVQIKTDVENLAAANKSAAATPSRRAPDVTPDGVLSVLGQAWKEWWSERGKWFALGVQTVLALMHVVCLLAFFSSSITNQWESGNRRQFRYTVGLADPWYHFETYPTETTPFRTGIEFSSRSWLFPLAGFALYYIVWRIEKARKPTAGWWSSPAPIGILWLIWALAAVGMGAKLGHDALQDSLVGGGLFAPQLRSAMSVERVPDRDEALRQVATQAAPAGDLNTVRRALREMRSGELHDQVAAECALALAKLKLAPNPSREIAEMIHSDSLRAAILARLPLEGLPDSCATGGGAARPNLGPELGPARIRMTA